MRIESVHLENFKKFKDLEIHFEPLDCLAGQNNSGKSTLLQSLALFDFAIHNCLERKSKNGNNDWKIKNRSIAPEDFIVLPVANAIDFWTDRLSQKQNKHIPIKINIVFDTGDTVIVTIELSYNRFSISVETKDNQEWLHKLSRFKISYLPVFSTFLTQEERRTPAVIEDALARGRVNSVIRNLLYNLKEENKIKELENILHKVVPLLQELSVSFDESVDRYIDVSYKEENKSKSFSLYMAGSGFQQFVYLFGFILLRDPDVILLDEPDVHLHGSMQGSLLEELKNLVSQGKQVIFATHSYDLITRIEPDRIINLNDDGQATRLKVNYDIYDTLKSLGSIDNIETVKLQTFKKLLIVEDKSDWEYLQIFGEKIAGTKQWKNVERRLAIFYNKGNPYKTDMPKLKEQLTNLLSITGRALKLFAISDLDYYPHREELLKELNEKDKDIEFYIWERTEIENYLLNPDVIYGLVASKSSTEELFSSKVHIHDVFNDIVESGKEIVDEKIISQFQYYSSTKNKGWDAGTLQKKTKDIIKQKWESEKLFLADAKKVLKEIRQYIQDSGYKQFSNKSLAQSFEKDEIHPEVKNIINKIVEFAGLPIK